ncbi:hypothetical protein GC170_14385 [bacterium]|nr:hypothetical protein [bacterium]
MTSDRIPGSLRKIVLAAAAYFLGQSIAWPLVGATSIKPPNLPSVESPTLTIAWFALSTLIISAGVVGVATDIRGGLWARWAITAALIYFLYTAGTAIELTVFTKFEGQAYLALAGILPAIACALVTVRLNETAPAFRSNLRFDGSMAGRLAVCWLAYPVVYFFFGSLISPFVLEDYMDDSSMLTVPSLSMLMGVLAIRSTIFLLPSIAVIERWQANRMRLWLVLGWSHSALVGLAGLVMPNPVLSPKLRLVHAVEISADSFAYAGILVLVLTAGTARGVAGTTGKEASTGSEGDLDSTLPADD